MDIPTRAPPCAIFETCGACDRMPLPEADQLADKAAHIARLVGATPDRVVPSPRSLGYRARIGLHVGAKGELGYHRPRSHTLVPTRRCPIARDEINAALAGLPPLPSGLERVELRSDGARVVLSAWSARRPGPALRSALAALPGVDGAALDGVALDGGAVAGETRLTLRAGGVEHEVGPAVFYQVNLEINALLVDAVLDATLALRPSGVLDLYAGTGNLGLPIASRGVRTTLWESDAAAIADARRTAKRSGLEVELRAADAASFRAGDVFFDVAVLDPPRAGAGAVLGQVLATRPRGLVLVSCNPTALARDLRLATNGGYRLSRFEVFDMFPQTSHAEVLVVLVRD